MAKRCWFSFALTAICLIFTALEADAHPVVDEVKSHDSDGGGSRLEVRIIASHGSGNEEVEGSGEMNVTCRLEDIVRAIKNEISHEIQDVKRLLGPGGDERNESRLEELVNMVRVIALQQQQNAREIQDVKRLLAANQADRQCTTAKPTSIDPTVTVESTTTSQPQHGTR